MLKEYLKFCDSPTTTVALDFLFAIKNCDVDYQKHGELFSIWEYGCRLSHESIVLNTSGSTDKPKQYRFGPLPEFWLSHIEKLIKYPKSHKQISVRNKSVEKLNLYSTTSLMYADKNEMHFSAFLSVPYFDDRTVDEMCKKLDELLAINQNLTLSANPNIWLYLTNDDQFNEYITNNKDISLSSTNWEAFFKTRNLRNSGVLINDNMVNWSNGLNFYTCRFGNKHSLPIFLAIDNMVINLLNLTGHVGFFDDSFSFFGLCQCGKKSIEFVPHIKTQLTVGTYDLELCESLISKYENLQFIQNNDQIDVCVMCDDMDDKDKQILCDFFVCPVFFINDAILMIENKSPVFYRNIQNNQIIRYRPYRASLLL